MFRNINHTCVALRDHLIVEFIRTDILIAYFFNTLLGHKFTVSRTGSPGRLRY